MPRDRKARGKAGTARTWFTDYEPASLFLWRCRPGERPLLLAGNKAGFDQAVARMKKLLRDQAPFSLDCAPPAQGPPIFWGQQAGCRSWALPIQEIERVLRSTVHPFERFVWYRRLVLQLSEDLDEPRARLRSDTVTVALPSRAVEAWIELFARTTFPAFGGIRLAAGVEGSPGLWLSADWLGAE